MTEVLEKSLNLGLMKLYEPCTVHLFGLVSPVIPNILEWHQFSMFLTTAMVVTIHTK